MEWLTCIRKAVDFMENHLEDDISAQDVAAEVNMSSFFFQKGFSLMTGFGIGEYIRNRRLYRAAVDLQKTDEKIIDIALRYCYETPESFAKAFSRFHGSSPSQVRAGSVAKSFLPLTIKISIQGGNHMDYRIKTMFPLKVIGFQEIFDSETSYEEIPKFWSRIHEKYTANVYAGNAPSFSSPQKTLSGSLPKKPSLLPMFALIACKTSLAGQSAASSISFLPTNVKYIPLPLRTSLSYKSHSPFFSRSLYFSILEKSSFQRII